MRSMVLATLLSEFALSSCRAQADHRINQDLAKELAERSKSGLALARFSKETKVLEVHFFDGRTENLPLEVDGELKESTQGGIAILDLDPSIRLNMTEAALRGDSQAYLEEFAKLGANIVLLSSTGNVVRRSAISVDASVVAVSKDGQRLAFVGVPKGVPETEFGVYLGDFTDLSTTRIFAFGSDDPRKQQDAVGKGRT